MTSALLVLSSLTVLEVARDHKFKDFKAIDTKYTISTTFPIFAATVLHSIMAPKQTSCSKEKLLAIIGQITQLHAGKGAPKKIVAARAGYPGGPKTPAFSMAVRRLQKKGLLENKGEDLILTSEGKEIASTCTELEGIASTNEEQQEKMRSKLSNKQQELFALLCNGPRTRQDLADTMGYESPKVAAFTMLLTRVKKLEFIQFPDKETVELADMAFPFGRSE
jgi:hypothetical protein